MSRQLSHECVLSDVFHTPYRSARLLDFKCWKYDKTKPNLKKTKKKGNVVTNIAHNFILKSYIK